MAFRSAPEVPLRHRQVSHPAAQSQTKSTPSPKETVSTLRQAEGGTPSSLFQLTLVYAGMAVAHGLVRVTAEGKSKTQSCPPSSPALVSQKYSELCK